MTQRFLQGKSDQIDVVPASPDAYEEVLYMKIKDQAFAWLPEPCLVVRVMGGEPAQAGAFSFELISLSA
jgi:hypothetical protein